MLASAGTIVRSPRADRCEQYLADLDAAPIKSDQGCQREGLIRATQSAALEPRDRERVP